MAALLVAEAVMLPVTELVRKGKGATQPVVAAGQPWPITAPAVSAALLGGLRALVADGLWLRTYLAWADGDLPATERLIRLVTTVDDRPICFWLNGARIMANDMPQWRLARERRGGGAAQRDKRIVEEQARAALTYLAEGGRRHPESAAICVETANIHLYRRGDLVAAAEWYRRAAALPAAPYYAARIHGELLRRLGRPREAYAWLCRLHPTLPRGDPEAMSEVVLGRIRDLENELNLSDDERYMTPPDCTNVRNRER